MCNQPTDTARYCPPCGEFIGDCCRNKPATRAWAATKKAIKGVRERYAAMMERN